MTAASSFVSDFCALARSNGLDAEALLRSAGVDVTIALNPAQRVPNEKLAALVISVWDKLGDEGMGLTARPIPRGAFHMMGRVAVGEATLRDALKQGARFYAMLGGAYDAQLIEHAELAVIRFDMCAPPRPRYHLFAEITALAWHRLASWLIGENVLLRDVCFDYPAPIHVAEYSYLFPAQHVFEAQSLSFSFPRHFLDRAVEQSRSTLDSFMYSCPEELFSQPKVDFSIASDLMRVLRQSFASGFPPLEQSAEQLHMTQRTLMRRLKSEGTSYQQLKDRVRRDRAMVLLKNRQLSVSDVAEAVGYSDAAVFARSFRKWTGTSPREFRDTDS
ncbi:MAG: AraC family transcriptional regulator [Congregibacter sp.]